MIFILQGGSAAADYGLYLKPVNYEEFGSCIDRLKISLYNNEVKEKPVVKKNVS